MSDFESRVTKKERIGGDELHEITKETIGRGDGPSMPILPGKYRLGHKLTFWEDLAAIAKECDEILSTAGLPKIEESNGFSGPYRRAEPLTEVWFAAKIGLMCRDIHQGKETPTEWTLERTLSLGQLLETRDWRRAFKDDTVRGIGTKAAASRGGESRRGEWAENTDEILSRMRALIDKGLSISAAANHLAPKYDTKPGSIRSLWYRHCK